MSVPNDIVSRVEVDDNGKGECTMTGPEFIKQIEAEIQAEENAKARAMRCPSSGKDVGRMIENFVSDEWKIQCPTCGSWWSGGSTVLADHDRHN